MLRALPPPLRFRFCLRLHHRRHHCRHRPQLILLLHPRRLRQLLQLHLLPCRPRPLLILSTSSLVLRCSAPSDTPSSLSCACSSSAAASITPSQLSSASSATVAIIGSRLELAPSCPTLAVHALLCDEALGNAFCNALRNDPFFARFDTPFSRPSSYTLEDDALEETFRDEKTSAMASLRTAQHSSYD